MSQKKYKYRFSFDRLSCLFFVSGILIGLMVYFYTEASYEDRIFKQLSRDFRAEAVDAEDSTRTSQLLSTMDFVHKFINPRQRLFSEIGGLKSDVIQPLSVDLMTGHGACGSYALVMTRLLKEIGLPVRLIQMKVDGTFGGHILLEAEYAKDKWAVLDPTYNLHFNNELGKLASFSEVQNNWDYYTPQLPADYDMKYRYDDKRYTNWEKIPIILPALKKTLEWIWGKEKVDHFSLRTLALNKFNVYFNCLLFLQILLFIYMAYFAYVNKRLPFQRVANIIIEKDAAPALKRKVILIKTPSKSITNIT